MNGRIGTERSRDREWIGRLLRHDLPRVRELAIQLLCALDSMAMAEKLKRRSYARNLQAGLAWEAVKVRRELGRLLGMKETKRD